MPLHAINDSVPSRFLEDQIAEQLGSRTINQKVVGSIPAVQNDDVSLGKALHPTCSGGMSLYLL